MKDFQLLGIILFRGLVDVQIEVSGIRSLLNDVRD